MDLFDNPDEYIFRILRRPRATGIVTTFAELKGNPEEFKDIFKWRANIPVQTHSLNVAIVDSRFKRAEDTDALITFCEDIPIGVVTADCVPVLIHCPDVTGVAAIHAGWKGTLGGIVDRTLDVLEEHGAKPENMVVAFGPSISQEYYEVDAELGNRFIEAGFGDYVSTDTPKPHIDLEGVNLERLLRRGVNKENIKRSGFCTFSSRAENGKLLFPSYRRDGKEAGRLLSSIMLLTQ